VIGAGRVFPSDFHPQVQDGVRRSPQAGRPTAQWPRPARTRNVQPFAGVLGRTVSTEGATYAGGYRVLCECDQPPDCRGCRLSVLGPEARVRPGTRRRVFFSAFFFSFATSTRSRCCLRSPTRGAGLRWITLPWILPPPPFPPA